MQSFKEHRKVVNRLFTDIHDDEDTTGKFMFWLYMFPHIWTDMFVDVVELIPALRHSKHRRNLARFLAMVTAVIILLLVWQLGRILYGLPLE